MHLKTDTEAVWGWSNRRTVIPAGTPVRAASNLPDDGEGQRYWVDPWEGVGDDLHSWILVYGLIVREGEVEV